MLLVAATHDMHRVIPMQFLCLTRALQVENFATSTRPILVAQEITCNLVPVAKIHSSSSDFNDILTVFGMNTVLLQNYFCNTILVCLYVHICTRR